MANLRSSDRHVDAVELAALRRRERERPRRLRHDARHARRLDREAQPLHLALVEQVERRRAAGELMQPRRHAVRRVADADAQDLGARGDERDAAGGDEREGGGARRDREVELVAERELHRGHRHRDLHEAAGRLGGDEERTVAVPAAEGGVPLLLAELELAAGAERGGVAVEQGSAAEHGVDDGGELRVQPRDGGEEEARCDGGGGTTSATDAAPSYSSDFLPQPAPPTFSHLSESRSAFEQSVPRVGNAISLPRRPRTRCCRGAARHPSRRRRRSPTPPRRRAAPRARLRRARA